MAKKSWFPANTTPNEQMEIGKARRLLASFGYVVLREKSYRYIQNKVHILQANLDFEIRERQHTESWAREDLCREIRGLRERVTFLYGAARAHGATIEELTAGDH